MLKSNKLKNSLWSSAWTSLSLFTFMHWRRKRQLTPVFLPGESQGGWSLVGCRLWGPTESDMTEATWQQPCPYELQKNVIPSCFSMEMPSLLLPMAGFISWRIPQQYLLENLATHPPRDVLPLKQGGLWLPWCRVLWKHCCVTSGCQVCWFFFFFLSGGCSGRY